MDHELLGGVHKKRAIKYSLDKLEGQKLIERCAAPTSYKGKGRKPVFWEAVGTDVPGKFSSRAREKSVNPPVKKQIPSPGTDLNNKGDCQKSEIVKSQDEGLLTKPGLLTNPIVVKNPSPGTDQPFNANTQRHKGFEDGVDDWNMWS